MVNRVKSVTIRGTTYPSRTAAAKALGVTPSAVSQAEKYGWLDHVGLARRKRGMPWDKVVLRTADEAFE